MSRMSDRRQFVRHNALLAASVLIPSSALAQAYPSRPVHIVVPFAPGGIADVLARLFGDKLSQRWGQPVVVDNRPGGGTVIGTGLVARAPADGHTLLCMSNSFVINAKLRADLPYDGMKAFQPVVAIAGSPQVLAVPAASRYQSLRHWMDDAKARKGMVSVGAVGPATTQHMAVELLQRAMGTRLIFTPFGGGAPAITAALGGHIDSVLANYGELAQHLEAGKLRALGVTTLDRLDLLPQVPTIAESGYPALEAVAWFGLVGPASMPADIVARIAETVRLALTEADIKQRLATLGLQPTFMSPADFDNQLRKLYATYARVIDDAKIKAE